MSKEHKQRDKLLELQSSRYFLYERKHDSQEHEQIIYYEKRIAELDNQIAKLGGR